MWNGCQTTYHNPIKKEHGIGHHEFAQTRETTTGPLNGIFGFTSTPSMLDHLFYLPDLAKRHLS